MLFVLDQPVEVIVVTALPPPRAERTLAVSGIDEGEIKRSPTTQLDQLLKTVPGVQLFRRSDARSGHPTSQGATLRALGGNAASRALLLLDGVPQADPFGGWINWPAYDPATLGAIRVTRGGGSVGSGPGALAGLIELDSRTIGDLNAEISGGSRGSVEARASAGLGSFTLSARGARGDGFVPVIASQRGAADRRAPYSEASVRGRYVASLADHTEAQLNLSGFVDRRERGVAFTVNRSRGADASVRLVGTGRVGWTALAYGQWRGFESSFASLDDERSVATRVALQDDVPSSALGGSVEVRPPLWTGVELRLGADIRRSRGHSHEYATFVAGSPTRERDSGGTSLTAGLFAEAAAIAGNATLTLGGRIDRWRISDGHLFERQLVTGAQTDTPFADRSGWLPTARAGAAYALGGGASLRAAAYLGWRLPTLNELFRPFRAGADATAANAALDPERLRGVEVGGRVARGGLRLDATLFANRLANPITNVTLGTGPGLFPGVGFVGAGGKYRQRQNAGALEVRGVELDGRFVRGQWSLRAGYSLADARGEDGLRPAQTPRHAAGAGIAWEGGRTTVSLGLNHVGAQFEDDLNQVRLPPATSIDAFVSRHIGGRVSVVLRAENLLNERVVAGVSGDGLVERATPRTLSIGLRLSD